MRPWNRTTARSSLVAAATGGIEESNPWGMSTRHVREVVLGQERQRLVAVALLHPRLVPELDHDPVVREPLLRREDLRLGPREITNHGGNWNRTATSLPAECSGIRASAKRLHDWSRSSSGRSFGYRLRLAASPPGSASRTSFVQLLGRRRVSGQQGERLDVEVEVGGRALRPQGGVALRGHAVERRVHLDDRELRRVVAQPLLRRLRVRWIEVRLLDQGLLGPRRDADPHLAHAHHPRERAAPRPGSPPRATLAPIAPATMQRRHPRSSGARRGSPRNPMASAAAATGSVAMTTELRTAPSRRSAPNSATNATAVPAPIASSVSASAPSAGSSAFPVSSAVTAEPGRGRARHPRRAGQRGRAPFSVASAPRKYAAEHDRRGQGEDDPGRR